MEITKANILIVDDDPMILQSLKMYLEQHFGFIRIANDPNTIPAMMNETIFDVVLLDMNFKPGDTSGEEGLYWLKKILETDPETNVIFITAYGEISKAVKAIKAGALDFVVKPWKNEKILATINAAVKLTQSKRKLSRLESQQKIQNYQFGPIIGQSPAIKKVFESIEKLAKTDANVLILGENGTGKELVAMALHMKSRRSDEPFVAVDLGSIPESLFESELFGHKKGAFTDAKDDRIGRFEAASGGTIFLDEIGNLSSNMQVKLLKVLQDKQVIRIGTNVPITVDVRLICATNMPLRRMINEGLFRQDLFYRINTVEIQIPPLRKRKDDIALLAGHFLQIYSRKYHKSGLTLPEYVARKLQKYEWPGNVRELQHAIERAVIMSENNTLRSGDFGFLSEDKIPEMPKELKEYNLESLEKRAIEECLKSHGGNMTRAAQELGLTRGALYRRMEKYDL
jgi:DNA-binding NtrC family response regulator